MAHCYRFSSLLLLLLLLPPLPLHLMMPDKDSIREPVTMETLDDLCSESSMDSSEAGGAVHSERGDDQQEGAHRPMTPTGIYGEWENTFTCLLY